MERDFCLLLQIFSQTSEPTPHQRYLDPHRLWNLLFLRHPQESPTSGLCTGHSLCLSSLLPRYQFGWLRQLLQNFAQVLLAQPGPRWPRNSVSWALSSGLPCSSSCSIFYFMSLATLSTVCRFRIVCPPEWTTTRVLLGTEASRRVRLCGFSTSRVPGKLRWIDHLVSLSFSSQQDEVFPTMGLCVLSSDLSHTSTTGPHT